MQVLLAVVVSCTAVNMMGKLKKAGATVETLEIKTEGSRETWPPRSSQPSRWRSS
jgi:uncharacterized OsmC-like protein